ncbi:MAG: transposase, partial [Desulfobulbaceae bacterium]|nr:transposase [Desulfobulbaceae bacterium]
MVYQLDAGKRRLLWIGRDRTAQTFRSFLGTRKMPKYHNASRLQAIFGCASIAKSSPEHCYACGFAQSVQPNLT